MKNPDGNVNDLNRLDDVVQDEQGNLIPEDKGSPAEHPQRFGCCVVRSLPHGLTDKQKITRRGSAELRLSDLSVTWNSKPENCFLPSWWENLNIRLFTDKKKWTEPQRNMMRKAGRVHGIRTSLVALFLAGMTAAGVSVRNFVLEQRLGTQAQIQEKENLTPAEGLVPSLRTAEDSQAPATDSDLMTYREPIVDTQDLELGRRIRRTLVRTLRHALGL